MVRSSPEQVREYFLETMTTHYGPPQHVKHDEPKRLKLLEDYIAHLEQFPHYKLADAQCIMKEKYKGRSWPTIAECLEWVRSVKSKTETPPKPQISDAEIMRSEKGQWCLRHRLGTWYLKYRRKHEKEPERADLDRELAAQKKVQNIALDSEAINPVLRASLKRLKATVDAHEASLREQYK